jgi:hypothetical protein
MNQEHIRLWTEAMVTQVAEWDAEQAWAEWEMQQDIEYQEAHPFDHDEPPYDEHDDSAHQCGKDW